MSEEPVKYEEWPSGGYLTGWNKAKYFRPHDGEHIIYKAKRDTSGADWHEGHYSAKDNDVKQLLTSSPMPCYFSMPFDGVSYWMRIPLAPGDKKR